MSFFWDGKLVEKRGGPNQLGLTQELVRDRYSSEQQLESASTQERPPDLRQHGSVLSFCYLSLVSASCLASLQSHSVSGFPCFGHVFAWQVPGVSDTPSHPPVHI